MLGGLSGKASLISHERKIAGDSILVLDSGKSLFKGKSHKKKSSLIQARGIAKAYMLMDYDAVAVSASDILNGELFLEETLDDGFPWISANLINKDGQPVTKSHVLKTINSLKIAIIGLTDKVGSPSKYSTIEYQTPLATLLKELTSQSDMIVLLSNLQSTVNQQIATQFPDIDIIFSSDRSLGKMAPKVLKNTLITQTSSRGKYLGKLDIEWNSGNGWYNDRLLPLSQLIKRKASIEFQLTEITKNTNASNEKKISRLQLQQQRLEKEIENRRIQEEERAARPSNRHKLSFIPVQPTNSPKSIESIVQNIDQTIKDQRKTN